MTGITDRLNCSDLYITTSLIPRTSIADLPYKVMVTCTRVGGWELWKYLESSEKPNALHNTVLMAGEYNDNGLLLDVNGVVIVDTLS